MTIREAKSVVRKAGYEVVRESRFLSANELMEYRDLYEKYYEQDEDDADRKLLNFLEKMRFSSEDAQTILDKVKR
jgi:hypothetical protein